MDPFTVSQAELERLVVGICAESIDAALATRRTSAAEGS
jgi:hypothetical protein